MKNAEEDLFLSFQLPIFYKNDNITCERTRTWFAVRIISEPHSALITVRSSESLSTHAVPGLVTLVLELTVRVTRAHTNTAGTVARTLDTGVSAELRHTSWTIVSWSQ